MVVCTTVPKNKRFHDDFFPEKKRNLHWVHQSNMDYTFRAVTRSTGIIIWRVEVIWFHSSCRNSDCGYKFSQISCIEKKEVCYSRSQWPKQQWWCGGKKDWVTLVLKFFLSVQQKMELVQIPEKSYGNFYEGDCYVLLSVSLRRWLIVVLGAVAACLFCKTHSAICRLCSLDMWWVLFDEAETKCVCI